MLRSILLDEENDNNSVSKNPMCQDRFKFTLKDINIFNIHYSSKLTFHEKHFNNAKLNLSYIRGPGETRPCNCLKYNKRFQLQAKFYYL